LQTLLDGLGAQAEFVLGGTVAVEEHDIADGQYQGSDAQAIEQEELRLVEHGL
jgi:hypothetical protein